jgi:primosomal protein N' (replication factor Y) (superfamily II helicase)
MTGRAVDVAVAVPRLELDRPFTYLLPEGAEAPVGTLVSVPFHGRTVKGWVIGSPAEVPSRLLRVRRVLSRTPGFRPEELQLYRWVGERYLSPLAAVIDRAHPPRVASEEAAVEEPPGPRSGPGTTGVGQMVPSVLEAYDGGPDLLGACREGTGAFVVRPLPGEEAATCLQAVSACLAGGRDAVVLVPEAEPLPATARTVMEVFGDAAVLFVGGERRQRYRRWLELLGGRYRVVVATRPGVFAPVRRLGLVWVHREAHPGHREDRAPYYRVSEVAVARARLAGAAGVLAGLSPSAASAAMVDQGEATLVRAPRQAERRAAPLVEVTRPTEEDRSPRLVTLLRSARSAFLLLSRRGYGVARVCRVCGEPARCATCGGAIAVRGGRVACTVCGAQGRCASCGGSRFGVERGGTERVQEWASGIARRSVARVDEGATASPPRGLVTGTAAAVKDFGDLHVDLVAILDADRARRRAGLSAPEQVLATWFEAAAWVGGRTGGGRVLLHTREPGDPAVQALVRWDPWHFHRAERRRLEEAGFPPGFPVFRVFGSPALADALRALDPVSVLASGAGSEAVCLVTIRPSGLGPFRDRVLELVAQGVVTRVEAEPQL